MVTAAIKLKDSPWKKSYDKRRQYIKKERYHFADQSPSSQAVVLPVVMYGCQSWTIKKAKCWRIDAFKLWCWRRPTVPWTARRSILREINLEYSLKGLMLKLKLQYFGHLMQRTDSLEKPWCWERLRAEREGNNRRWDGWMVSRTQWTWVSSNSGRQWRTGNLECCSLWGRKESDLTWPPNNNK